MSGLHVMTRTLCHDKHWRGAPMLIGAHISQVASSTPFLRCSRFSPIAFNLSNTKPSIQLLHVPDCPFQRPKPNRSYPMRPPLHFESSKAETRQSTLTRLSIALVSGMETYASKTRNAPEPTSDSPESDSEPHQPTMADLFALLSRMNRRLDALENSRSSTPSGHSAGSEDSPAEQADRPPVLTVRPNTLRDPKMAPPEPFSGKISEFKNFMVQCTLIFSVCPNTYCTDERRVLFVISRLKDEPLTWANEIAIDPAHPLRHNYERFKQQLTNIYGDRAFKAKSEDQLLSLRQTGSAALYAQKFQSYAAPLNINDDVKCLMFFGGLKSDIQKACTMAGRAAPFYALVDPDITFSQLSYQHSKRESGNSSESGSKKQRR